VLASGYHSTGLCHAIRIVLGLLVILNSGRRRIFDACVARFRPIMMTTMAALMGTLPIALGLGASGKARRPLGLAVVGGRVVSRALTLYIALVVYLYRERPGSRFFDLGR
jgi:Cu/Ag efflux pump CusA